MVKVSVTVEGEPSEVRETLIKLAGGELILPMDRVARADTPAWAEEEFLQFWRTIQEGARQILGEIAKRPDSYPFADLARVLNLEGLQIAGRLSSVGHVLRRFPGKAAPVSRDYNARVYRMPAYIAEMVLNLNGHEST